MTSGCRCDSQRTPGLSPYPLFSAFPSLRCAVPRIPIGLWPTLIDKMPRLAEAIGSGPVYVKRDDQSAFPYGGNKIRKLEILLGSALRSGACDVITFGAAGSNHALATAIYGKMFGLNVTAMLTPQPNAEYVRRNLLAHLAAGTDIRMHPDKSAALADAERMCEESRRACGCEPYVIPFGGTNALSTIGFVNAGFELSGQIRSGAIPAPDVVYVALGSMGTAAGIALGLALGSCTPAIRAVAVTPPSISNKEALCALIDETAELLTQGDEAVPADLCSRIDIEVVDGYLGEEYALFTPEGVEAVGLALAAERLHLEGTYTGKTLAALISDGTSGKLAGKTTLFWNTYNSQDLGAFIGTQEYRKLPEAAWTYFESDLQPLDTGGI